VAVLEAHGAAVLQLDDKAPFGIDETLCSMGHPRGRRAGIVADLDQLRGHRLLRLRRLVLGNLKLGGIVNRDHPRVQRDEMHL